VSPTEMIIHVANRMERKAKDLELRATISSHEKAALVGHLRSSSALILEAIKKLESSDAKHE
jgi:hypothetical protein